MSEPRAVNRHGVSRNVWRKLSESERHHFLKMYGYMYPRQEEFIPEEKRLETKEWENLCKRVSLLSISTSRRGMLAKYLASR